MKTIGLVGGSGWISTADYYRIVNEEVNRRLGGNQFAKVALYSVNFNDIMEMAALGQWQGISDLVLDGAKRVVAAGADCVLLCANTWHLYADLVRESIPVPLIHIGEETAHAVHAEGIKKVALLGTKPTMEKDFIKGILQHNGIEVIVPEKEDRNYINKTIVEEFMLSRFEPATKARYLEIIHGLQQQGAEGVILGCTEIPLLINQQDFEIKSFDTLHIHAMAAVDFALS